MCRVTVAVLCLYGKVDRLVNILDSYDRKNGHHKLVLNEGMLKVCFTDNTSYLVAYVDTELCKDDLCITAYAVTADDL